MPKRMKDWPQNSMVATLLWLKQQGCRPSLYMRGPTWRAHTNVADNLWREAANPYPALLLACEAWDEAGRPILKGNVVHLAKDNR